MVSEIRVRRVYDEMGSEDGWRILIDGLWPRGVSREQWPEGTWRPELSPSAELRRWYGHDPERFEDFVERYRAELEDTLEGREAVGDLLTVRGRLTLVTATRDILHSHAQVLADFLSELAQIGEDD